MQAAAISSTWYLKPSFDCKKLGASMLTDGFDLNAEFDQMNQTWADARKS